MSSATVLKPKTWPADPGPLDPLSFELAERIPAPREAILGAWNRLLDAPRFPIDQASIAEPPLIGSRALIDLVDRRVLEVVEALKPQLARQDDPAWPFAPAADVLSADLAIVRAPETKEGWDLRWVELQAFTSLVSTIYTLHRAAAEVWPELANLKFWGALPEGDDWLDAARQWMAPEPGGILLENAPWSQPTRSDFEAARRWFGLAITDPKSLRARSGQLERCDGHGFWHPVPHVANRLILHEAEDRAHATRLLSSVTPSWNSHPAWYYRVDKGVLPELPLAPGERCVRADRWRELELPPERLVAKRSHSHSGKGVMLNVDASALDALPSPCEWIVQPRFMPMPVCQARDGADLYAELRCVVALPQAGRPPWLVCRLARLSRSPMLSTKNWSGAPGEGAVPVYAPPDTN